MPAKSKHDSHCRPIQRYRHDRLWMGLCLLILISLGMAGCVSVLTDRKPIYQEVLYATTRQDSGSPLPSQRYTQERGPTSFGAAMIGLTPKHTVTSVAKAQPNRLMDTPQSSSITGLQAVQSMEKPSFVRGLQVAAEVPDKAPQVLIYIHGYNRDFKKAVMTAAHLRYELAFPGAVIAFAWPSQNALTGYLADRANIDWSEPALRELINDVGQSVPNVTIHLIAHSMGNQALLTSLLTLKRQSQFMQGWSLGEIVLVAPDIDRGLFHQDLAKRLGEIPVRLTLYVSSEDFPLMASAALNAHPRLGDASQGVPLIDGVETIDVSESAGLMASHTYYEEDQQAMEDMYYLLNHGIGAALRPTVKAVKTELGTYWQLKDANASFNAIPAAAPPE